MKSVARVLPALLFWGCASSGPQPAVTRPALPGPLQTSTLPANPGTSCDEVLERHAAGDHKPAVDAMRILHTYNVVCSPATDAAFEASRETLHAADQLVRTGLDQRDRREMSAARASFEQALALYPKYYWVRALEATLSNDNSAPTAALREQAAQLRSESRIEEALAVLEQAQSLAPTEAETLEALSEVRTQVAFRHLAAASQAVAQGRLEDAAGSVLQAIAARPEVEPARHRVSEDARNIGLSLFSAGELIKARDLWQAALELDQTNVTLLEYVGEVDARLQSLAAIQDNSD